MPSVNIIGAGRVGRTFLRLLGRQAQDIASATRASAAAAVKDAGHGQAVDLAAMRPADIWFLTVPDTQIAEAASALADIQAPPAIAVHCSGFHTADIMTRLRAKGWHLASAHPNLSFADPDIAAATFHGTPVGIEGDARAVTEATTLFQGLGARTFPIATDKKALYHAAAVFSNNFATALQAIARDAWAEAGVPPDLIAALNRSLLDATARNVARLGPKDALTGPAARGDTAIVEAQHKVVTEWRPEAGQLYHALSHIAADLKAR